MKTHTQLISRRTFCAASAAVAMSALPVRAADQRQPESPSPRYIDVHTHIGQTWNHTRELTAPELLKWMDEHGTERAVVLPVVSPEAASFLLTSDFVLAQTKPHRDRLIPFCCIDPRTAYTGKRHGLKHMLQRYVDQGVKGFGEHKPGVAIDDPRNMELYAVCGELKLPILFHLDEQRNTDAPGLPGLEKVLRQNPDTILIGHGPGWWASISGDVTEADLGSYPKGPVAAGGAIDRLMDKYTNLYGDLSAGSGAGALARDEVFGRAFLIRRQERIVFGTDYVWPGQEVPQIELLPRLNLTADVGAKIAHENAKRILRLNA
jgi:predicted TIM-barrel fold metal-dependent hydrolase